ncbi:ATP-binding protein [Mucilaginibacter psychrotolerans]|uniref:histidine kinase n=1 Tax=Mucilaginibacter psychrotolerans TaxID=1524096 RepID=A0A4Y8RY85_9SPHI|nr:ATP-binding protein [Mucilaginibacter psychrotolerans]TFF29721.1 CBS domain-containing protein [Mucilaginibacter psychrotolerans]
MKIDNLIEKSFTRISVFKKMADVAEQVLIQGYIPVEGENSKVLGIITLKDYHINHKAEIFNSEIEKPRIKPGHTIFEVRELMKTSQSDYLPVYEADNFIGVVSVGNITDRLIHINKRTRLNYQKVIHDVRNPIANIQGIIEIISDAVNDKESVAMLELSIQSCKHAMDILDDLLFVELDEDKPLVLQPTEMNKFFMECVNEQNGIAFQKNIQIKTEFEQGALVKAIDRKQFKRAIQNIMSNAIKFSVPGSVIKISSKIKDDEITLKIVDSGIGIPENLQGEIFKKFSIAQRTGTNGETSTGLGLCFTKQCVERHQGVIEFKSEVGKGTKFYITV